MKRVITALLLAPTVIAVVLYAPAWLFLAVVGAVAFLAFHEFRALVAACDIPTPGPAAYAAGFLWLAMPEPSSLVVVLVALLFLSLSLSASRVCHALPYAGAAMLGFVYVFGVWKCAILLRGISPWWLLFALLASWLGDSAAYYGGKAFGRHKLAPAISPNKTWEGSIAGLTATLAFGIAFAVWRFPDYPLAQMVLLSLVANAAGQFGDLAESALKRCAGLKDSGALLPGHGGWLDRVDSSMFAIPAVYALLQLTWFSK